jgi:hypothetical protein
MLWSIGSDSALKHKKMFFNIVQSTPIPPKK